MHRLSIHAKTALTLCAALALLAGCGTETDGGPKAGCVAAYDDSYRCHSLVQNVSALDPVYSSGKPQECAEFVRNLDDGRYWLTGTDETGAVFDSLVVVGETGWMEDGRRVDGACVTLNSLCRIAEGEIIPCFSHNIDEVDAVCRLTSVSADSIQGKCAANNRLIATTPDESGAYEETCQRDECSFAFAVGVSDTAGLAPAISCLHRKDCSFAENLTITTVTVSVSDTLVSIVAPNVEVTWTKRPGL